MITQRFSFVLCLVALMTIIVAGTAQARLINVRADVRLHNASSGPALNVWVEVASDAHLSPGAYVTGITLIDPLNRTIAINPATSWDQFGKGFGFIIPRTHTYWGGVIPSGTYKVKVTDAYGSITASDTIDNVPLAVGAVTYPVNAQTGVLQTPVLRWSAVAGATHYRIHLFDVTASLPVYSYADGLKNDTNFTFFTVPKGVLRPNHQYRIYIEARAGYPDPDKRSLTNQITFTTATW